MSVNAGSVQEEGASVVRVWGRRQAATFQPDKTKFTQPGPTQMSSQYANELGGPLSVRAVQAELRGVCEPRVDV